MTFDVKREKDIYIIFNMHRILYICITLKCIIHIIILYITLYIGIILNCN